MAQAQVKKPKLIQDWSPYNESKIWDIANHYYKNKGVAAFASVASNAVPHGINTNYQSALAVAELLKANLPNLAQDQKVQVLECGAGSGLFSYNFLNALRDIGILDRVSLLISEYTEVNLKQIKDIGILSEYQEGVNYEFALVDVLNLPASKKLNGEPLDLQNFSLVILNYVLDALPLTVLRRHANPKLGDFEELYLKLIEPSGENGDLLANTSYTSNLIREHRWQNYKIDEQSDLEKKYYHHINEFYARANPKMPLPYPYMAMQACENLLKIIGENGFVISSDIPFGKTSFCQIVGNALAHEIDNDLIASYFSSKGVDALVENENIISRIVLAKKPETITAIRDVFYARYITNNQIKRYIDLREVLIKFQYKESGDVMKYVLDEFAKLAKYSPYPGIYLGNYYQMHGDTDGAIRAFKEARRYDFLDSYKLDSIIKNLESV